MKNRTQNDQKPFDKMSGKARRKPFALLLALAMILTLAACGNNPPDEMTEPADSFLDDTPISVQASSDKYTWYIKNYVGKNCASIGYTSMSEKRLDDYGEGQMELVFVSTDGHYVDVGNEDALKEYVVIKQNLAPNTELKLTFDKDSDGNEYDSLVASQSFEEIVLYVKKVGSADQAPSDLTVIQPSPDKYTRYIADYTGRNLASCGYVSLGGGLMHQYGEGYIELVIVADDGTFVDPEDTESLRDYVVTGQSVAPNTELKLVFDKDSDGVEYDSLVESQSIEEIELYVKRISSAPVKTKAETTTMKPAQTTTTKPAATTKPTTTKPTTTKKPENPVNGMRPEFKAAMDSYEKFMNEYVTFMKKYKANPSDLSILADYADYMSKYGDFVADFEKWETDEKMNAAETAYYIDVQARVSKQLLEVAG
ncbi:MAG: DUF6591 domain-containing protein [Acutalibacteraceae bacterium]